MKLESALKINLFWDYFNRFGNTAISLVITTILSRVLNPADYGLVGISMAVTGFAGIFLNLGFVSAIIQAEELNDKSLSTVFFLNIGIALLMYIVIFSLSSFVGDYYCLPQLGVILKIAAFSFVINSFCIVPNALMTRGMKFKQMSVISLISSLVSGVIGVFLALSGYGVWSIIVQQLINGALLLLGFFISTKWTPILYFKFKSIDKMLKFGIYMFFSGFLEMLYSRIDIFLIAKLFNPSSLGLYSRAQGLDITIRNLSSTSLLSVLFPTFAKIRDDREQLKLMYYQYFQMISFLFCLLGGALYISAEHLFLFLFGAKWGVSAVYFKILVLAGFAYPLSSLTLSIIEARGNSRNFFIVELVKKVLFLPIYFIAYIYGIIPFLFSYVVACFIGTFVNVRFLKFELEISIAKTFKFLIFYLGCSILLIYLLGVVFSEFQIQEGYFSTGSKVVIFIFIYYLINRLFNSNGLKYSKSLFYNSNDQHNKAISTPH